MSLQSHKDLIVWQKSMLLVKEMYHLTESFPKDELYGLRSQMERAAVSIPSQIAEGYLRRHHKEYVQFLSIALGSAAELETQILVCEMLTKFKNIDFTQAKNLDSEIMKMLYVLIDKIVEGERNKRLNP